MLFVEGLAMLRQLIGQVQELLDVYGSPFPPPFPTAPLPHHHLPTIFAPPSQLRNDRWCFVNLEENDDCYDVVMRGGKLKMLGESRISKRARKLAESPSKEAMEDEIWKEFPEDLHEAVIARLPVATFFRFRSVCQKWNSLLTSSSFSIECSRLPNPQQPWFYTSHENINTGEIYDPVAGKWHHPTAPAIPTKMIILPMAAAGGLVCFLDIGHRSFYVCNPLTRSFKELKGSRSVRVWSRVAVGMSVKQGGYGYVIMWVGSEGEYEVYDSAIDSWTCPGNIKVTLPLSLNFRSQSVSVDGWIYFLRSDPDGIVGYDVETGNWKQFTVPAPVHLSDQTLAECGGRIMLVGLLRKNAATCVCIWELQKMTLLWKEVDRMPNVWCLEFYGKHIKMSCLGNRGLLLLSLRSKMMNRLVTYNVFTKEWLKVPNSRNPQSIACGTAFHPCLTAKA
ncbi:hypothetical protein LXL04_020600 [Taraxacum kok-saghyz]